jgi:hypothetical protein
MTLFSKYAQLNNMLISYDCLIFIFFYLYLFVIYHLASYYVSISLGVPEKFLKSTRFGGHMFRSYGVKKNASTP